MGKYPETSPRPRTWLPTLDVLRVNVEVVLCRVSYSQQSYLSTTVADVSVYRKLHKDTGVRVSKEEHTTGLRQTIIVSSMFGPTYNRHIPSQG